jgi:hypothetical protein
MDTGIALGIVSILVAVPSGIAANLLTPRIRLWLRLKRKAIPTTSQAAKGIVGKKWWGQWIIKTWTSLDSESREKLKASLFLLGSTGGMVFLGWQERGSKDGHQLLICSLFLFASSIAFTAWAAYDIVDTLLIDWDRILPSKGKHPS